MTHIQGQQFQQLIRPFPPALVKAPPKGKHGTYVGHFDVGQAALRIVGPHSFGISELIRGEIAGFKTEKKEYPARANGVVGVVAELTCTIDGQSVTIREVGTEDNPAMGDDAANAKNALSDAYKRCWMRLGLGLHLWTKDTYWLESQITKDIKDLEKPYASTETEKDPLV